jgi:hypothetical protein
VRAKATGWLRPVAFRYNEEIDPGGRSQMGLVAEDVEKVNPDLVVCDKEGKPYSVRYDQVNAMLLNEFLKEYRKVEQLEKQVAALTAGLQKVSAQLELTKFAPQTGAQQFSKAARIGALPHPMPVRKKRVIKTPKPRRR